MSEAPERIWMDMRPMVLRLHGKPFVTSGVLADAPRTEYVRADLLAAKDVENAELREFLIALLSILEGFRGTVVLNESRWELIDRARALVEAETPVAAPQTVQEPRSGVSGSDTPGKPSGDTR